MYITLRVVLAFLPLLASARIGLARCDPSVDPDKSDIAHARAAVAANCDCATASTHGAFVDCAADHAATVLANKRCAGFVRRCASRSICGKPGFVTCCRINSRGKTRCARKRDATKCVAPRGGSACVGSFPSCCDACVDGGCATTTTTTSTTTSTTADPFRPCGPDATGTCGGICSGGVDLCVQDAQTGECVCVEGPCRAVGGFGSCYGTCLSPAATCTLCAACGGCGCIIPCNGGSYPTCNGTCPPSYACGTDGIDPGCLCIAQ
jgi:hypothetical protein